MKTTFRILLILIFSFSSTQCITALLVFDEIKSDISKDKGYLEVEVFQVLTTDSALARTENYDVVKVISYKDTYYDGKKIRGQFTRVGTYDYTTIKGVDKTVPVFIRSSELKQ